MTLFLTKVSDQLGLKSSASTNKIKAVNSPAKENSRFSDTSTNLFGGVQWQG